MIDENLQLVILNNTGKEKSDDEVAVLNLAMSDLVEKLEEARDEKLNINHSFSSLHPAPFPSVQFQLTMTRAERNEERKVGVRKMYPVKVVSINFKIFFVYKCCCRVTSFGRLTSPSSPSVPCVPPCCGESPVLRASNVNCVRWWLIREGLKKNFKNKNKKK